MAAVFLGSGLPHRPRAPTTEKRTPGPPLAGRSLFRLQDRRRFHAHWTPMRLVTWNINSLRLRLDLLRRLVKEEQPDVICLQEIKVQDSEFPEDALKAMGYPHILRHGMKSYNGVAILSRLPFLAKDPQNWCDKGDSRHGRAILGGD